MSQPPAISYPSGGIRVAFEAASRSYESARDELKRGGEDPARASKTVHARDPIEAAIAKASRKTGIDFNFLIAQAQVESSMDPSAKARTSSAKGLYQFIDSTWLQTLRKHGSRFGLGNIAAEIGINARGQAHVAAPAKREAILALRENPQVAALMAASLAEDNRDFLTPILGREPDPAELYLAHFLGAEGAGRFLSAMTKDPTQNAVALFARPAAANRAVFYERSGSPRSLAGVLEHLSTKLEGALGSARRRVHAVIQQTEPSPRAPQVDLAMADGSFAPPRQRPSLPSLETTRASGSAIGASVSGRAPISQILYATFLAPAGENSATQEQVRHAYDRLKEFGL
ncbi:lytic transglycosylase domain protein [Erythrobacter litoralis]|uniref:transglycosylase SLT domain-containing protein n=1 Tax=Erythrobacter litoralis TaxID=39960 RepID=UPI0006905123|nr:transglycosylase SLT domain-containing protein [Erythrobacter litoralis]AOL22250.1 lytic transglycosylase domain protein [Erythrobacter litoralis]